MRQNGVRNVDHHIWAFDFITMTAPKRPILKYSNEYLLSFSLAEIFLRNYIEIIVIFYLIFDMFFHYHGRKDRFH